MIRLDNVTKVYHLGEVDVHALRALTANKLRSSLTMLGIIIGVMAVVALLSMGQGAQASIIGQIQGIGANLVFVTPGQVQQGGVATAASAATLTLEDAEAIAATVPNVAAMAPEYSRNAQVVYREQRSRHQPGGHADIDPLRDPATGRRRLCGAGG